MVEKSTSPYLFRAIAFSLLLVAGIAIVQNLIAFLIAIISKGANSVLHINIEFITVLSWFGMVFSVLLSIAFAFNKKQSLFENLGLKTTGIKFLFNFISGAGTSLVFYLLFFSILLLNGYLKVGFNENIQKVYILFAFSLFVSITEELSLRGYLLNLFVKENKRTTGIFFTSLLFSVMHILNKDIAFLVLFNLFLVGVFLSTITILTKSIYFAFSMHLFFNLFEGLSGMDNLIVDKPFSLLYLDKLVSCTIIDGGSNGLTGSIVLTITLGVLIGILFMKYRKLLD